MQVLVSVTKGLMTQLERSLAWGSLSGVIPYISGLCAHTQDSIFSFIPETEINKDKKTTTILDLSSSFYYLFSPRRFISILFPKSPLSPATRSIYYITQSTSSH